MLPLHSRTDSHGTLGFWLTWHPWLLCRAWSWQFWEVPEPERQQVQAQTEQPVPAEPEQQPTTLTLEQMDELLCRRLQQQLMPVQLQLMPVQLQLMPVQQQLMPMQQQLMPMQQQLMPMQLQLSALAADVGAVLAAGVRAKLGLQGPVTYAMPAEVVAAVVPRSFTEERSAAARNRMHTLLLQVRGVSSMRLLFCLATWRVMPQRLCSMASWLPICTTTASWCCLHNAGALWAGFTLT